MRVHVETLLPCSPPQMWEAIQSTALLMEVTPGEGAASVLSPQPLPAQWTDVKQLVLQLPLFGRRTIDVVCVDDAGKLIRTSERDAVVRRWDHEMRVRPAPDGRSWYSDTVEIEAGPWTVPVFLLAQMLYRTRHRGWMRIARRLAAGSGPAPR